MIERILNTLIALAIGTLSGLALLGDGHSYSNAFTNGLGTAIIARIVIGIFIE